MSRYSELSAIFDKWRTDWVEAYREIEFLPRRLSNDLREYLGCPQDFGDPGDKTEYVSPASAEFDESTGGFKLTPYKKALEDLEFDDTGHFYFGIRIFLEKATNIYPKMPFWFLFKGKYKDSGVEIRIEQSKEIFNIDRSSGAPVPLLERIVDLIKAAMTDIPLNKSEDKSGSIGFVKLK